MTVNVLVFGPYADAVGDACVEVVLPDEGDVTAAEVLELLSEQHPALRAMLVHAMLAVNNGRAEESTVVRPGDELAIIGLVSGG